ncbi:MetQ/NlpA family ABC transporter substrate-binding protein [Aquibacillus sp. 3ASR75-11]|uniref:Lipoprotein n=1 Tax=Terrihalobacillus insolitus TaxID=2950438 RepID=A0A9X3WSD7_9BACI|nr:MetQ/NlpA family ABC transporter substrate-binding protein [Terrihalobacillus insolitus]MDC3411917.1 MetQ/NlpA family ABC transporter substrate-binding protein [Terrihalobacillus insolitus]MDC3423396.1 MetQ/NlpA family ABC transporter substrate-binding protein [Terrihalobacillus insolitus]
MKKSFWVLLLIFIVSTLSACGSDESTASNGEKKELVLGGTIPYSDMLKEAVKPYLEEKGYTVTVKEFNDYVQPNKALDNGSLDANLFQHKVYMDAFAEENDMELSSVITVPTAPIGIYSNKYETLDDIEKGSTVAVANDPTNLARGLTVLKENGVIEFDSNVDPLRATVKNITSNPKELKFKPVEAAQLPRTLESVDLAAINGNFAISAGLDLTTAIVRDKLPENIINRVVVKTENMDKQYVKDIKEAVQSDEFRKVIDEKFQGFHKPDWMN